MPTRPLAREHCERNTDYTTNQAHPGQSVVDYTPRMISQLVTTGGSTPLLDANGQVVHWNAALNTTPVTVTDAGAYNGLDRLRLSLAAPA